MEKLLPRILKIAQKISETENQRVKLANFLKEISKETSLSEHVEHDVLAEAKIVGVDGGLVKKSLHGLDFLLVRAVAACFYYKKDRVSKVDYHPSKHPLPLPEVMESLSEIEWSYFSSLTRQMFEVGAAREAMERFKPDMVIMHGMIFPHYLDKPSKGSGMFKEYEKLISEYKSLYNTAINNNILLCGTIEDSKNISFCNYIDGEIFSKIKHPIVPELKILLKNTRDTNLLFLLLQKGERTKVLELGIDNPILKDLEGFSDKIKSFYLKTAQWDRPLKIDFLANADPDRLAALILALSGKHSSYGLPAPIIEADNVARLSETDMENFYNQVISHTGNIPSMIRLRREMRPF